MRGRTRFSANARWLHATLACVAFASLGWLPIAHAQIDPIPGSFHTQNPGSFGAGTGRVLDLALPFGGSASRVVLQSDGRIVVAGNCTETTNTDFCVARLNANGTFDDTFDGPVSLGVGNGKFAFPVSLGNDFLRSLAIQPDGKILLAGQCESGFSQYSYCIARLLPNGEFDGSFGPFGSAGRLLISQSITSTDSIGSILIRPNGKIALVGGCGNPEREVCVIQLNSDGLIDETFDGSSNANGRLKFPIALNSTLPRDAALTTDGRIVIAATCQGAVSLVFCLARINADGTFDETFDGPAVTPGDGRFALLFPLGSLATPTLAIQADGKIVIAANCNNGSNDDFCVGRLNMDGSFDAAFDGPLGNGNGQFLLPMTASENEYLRSVAVQSDGKILLFGTCGQNNGANFCIARLYDDGSLDRSFDGSSGNANGAFEVSLGADDSTASGMALQTDGRIVLIGSCTQGGNAGACIVRLNAGPHANRACRLDIDGDGEIRATSDGLIVSRVLRGQRGASVLSGMSFAPHATRTTWPSIRRFLVSHCQLAVH
jgi:uncharacterized delta-60 repeat protein